jgi:hypothetical protein
LNRADSKTRQFDVSNKLAGVSAVTTASKSSRWNPNLRGQSPFNAVGSRAVEPREKRQKTALKAISRLTRRKGIPKKQPTTQPN